MDKKKVEAFTDRILKQCEQEGLTLDEVRQIPLTLRHAIDFRLNEIFKQIDIKGFRVE